MKRKALLIGNTNGLQGVKVDLSKFQRFLKSCAGGAWYDSEISIFEDVEKKYLLQEIEGLRKQNFDYVVVVFSGHGGQGRETLLELNSQGEMLFESSLRKIASRQLNIYDCCRAYPQSLLDSLSQEAALSASLRESVDDIRKRYDGRIMQAVPQQALLYSCSIGQVSYDTSDGGVYLTSLLESAQKFADGESFKLVGQAHQDAIALIKAKSHENENEVQTPEAVLPKCLVSQCLIISING